PSFKLPHRGHFFAARSAKKRSFFTLSKRKGLPHPFRLTTAAIDDYWLSPLFAFVTTIGAAALAARRGWGGEAEEPTGQCDVVGPIGVGEEAVVTDAVEPIGQDMDQEAADELVGVERHQLLLGVALGPVILPLESHPLSVHA